MAWTHCTGDEHGCGGWYQSDYHNECQMANPETGVMWTPEELEEFRTSPFWAEHERQAQLASKRGRFPVAHKEGAGCGCGR